MLAIGGKLTAKAARAAGRAASQAEADARAAELQAAGCVSLRALADGLDARRIPTAKGGKWAPTQVMRLLERIGPFDASAAAA